MSRYITDNTELRNLIINNPTLPLVFFATEEANSGDYQTEQCSISCYIDEVLDTDDTPYGDKIYMDRDDLEEDIRDMFYDGELVEELRKGCITDNQFDEYVQKELDKYEPYWTKCIVVMCG